MNDPPFERELVRQSGLDAECVAMLRDAYLRACRDLGISDGADPRTAAIAQAAITAGYEGVRDPQEIYRRALAAG